MDPFQALKWVILYVIICKAAMMLGSPLITRGNGESRFPDDYVFPIYAWSALIMLAIYLFGSFLEGKWSFKSLWGFLGSALFAGIISRLPSAVFTGPGNLIIGIGNRLVSAGNWVICIPHSSRNFRPSPYSWPAMVQVHTYVPLASNQFLLETLRHIGAVRTISVTLSDVPFLSRDVRPRGIDGAPSPDLPFILESLQSRKKSVLWGLSTLHREFKRAGDIENVLAVGRLMDGVEQAFHQQAQAQSEVLQAVRRRHRRRRAAAAAAAANRG